MLLAGITDDDVAKHKALVYSLMTRRMKFKIANNMITDLKISGPFASMLCLDPDTEHTIAGKLLITYYQQPIKFIVWIVDYHSLDTITLRSLPILYRTFNLLSMEKDCRPTTSYVWFLQHTMLDKQNRIHNPVQVDESNCVLILSTVLN
jgi:hypothetical protein